MNRPEPLNAASLLELIQHRRFGVEYQPLIHTRSGQIFGYEALARFYRADGRSLSPLQVFDALHHSPLSLFQVEYAMKRLQWARAPAEGRLFVNLDPHAASAWGPLDAENPLVRLFAGRSRVVVELIENTSVSDAQLSQTLGVQFNRHGVLLALDDLGAPGSLLSLPILVAVDFIKFDRSWAGRLTEPDYCNLMAALVHYARQSGKGTVLEGVETEQQRAEAKRLGIDYVQGFLFRERFLHYRPAHVGDSARAGRVAKPAARTAAFDVDGTG